MRGIVTMSTVVLYQFNTGAAVAEWLTQKRTTGSARTANEYQRTIESFQRFLAELGRDVLPITAHTQEEVSRHAIDIARLAPSWANARVPARLKKDGMESVRFDASSPVSASMYNQRLAILSSFYAFIQDTYKLA